MLGSAKAGLPNNVVVALAGKGSKPICNQIHMKNDNNFLIFFFHFCSIPESKLLHIRMDVGLN